MTCAISDDKGRELSEDDTMRLIVLAIKHIDKKHHDWDELIDLVQRFNQSKQR